MMFEIIKCYGLSFIKCLEFYCRNVREVTRKMIKIRLQRKVDIQSNREYTKKKPTNQDYCAHMIYKKGYQTYKKPNK